MNRITLVAIAALILAATIIYIMFFPAKGHAWEATIYGNTADGWIYSQGYGSAFEDARDNETGDAMDDTDASASIASWQASDQLRRGFLYFDTTAYAGLTVESAQIWLYSSVFCGCDNNTGLVLVSGAQSAVLTLADYDAFVDTLGTGELDRIVRADWLFDSYNTWTIPAAAVQSQLGGMTKFVMQTTMDYDNNPANYGGVCVFLSDSAGTTYDPYLKLTFADPVITDDFNDGSLDAKWDLFGDALLAGGTAAESGGRLVLTWPAIGNSQPYAAQSQGPHNYSFDVRSELNITTLLSGQDVAMIVFSAAWDRHVSVKVRNGGANTQINRQDFNPSGTFNGAATIVDGETTFFLRVVGDGDGTATCYYKLACADAWILLGEPGTPTTGFVDDEFHPVTLLANQDAAGGGSVYFDWITQESENAGWPICGGATPMMQFF